MGESLNPPTSRRNPLLRQLALNAQNDQTGPLVPPKNPLLRNLVSKTGANLNSLDVPIFRQDVTAGAGAANLNFQSLMTALTMAAGREQGEMTVPSVLSPLNSVKGGIDF